MEIAKHEQHHDLATSDKIDVSAVGVVIRRDLEYEEWENLVRQAGEIRGFGTWAIVDLPDPDRPVNQIITLLCLFSCSLRLRLTVALCSKVFGLFMLLRLKAQGSRLKENYVPS